MLAHGSGRRRAAGAAVLECTRSRPEPGRAGVEGHDAALYARRGRRGANFKATPDPALPWDDFSPRSVGRYFIVRISKKVKVRLNEILTAARAFVRLRRLVDLM